MKINGATYEEIAAKGGGILNSAKKLQQTSEEELFERTLKRARKLLRELGWIRPYASPVKRGPGGWRANKYILSGGPDDLLFDETDKSDGDDTGA